MVGRDRRHLGAGNGWYGSRTTLGLLRRRFGCDGFGCGFGCDGFGRLPRPTLRRRWHRCGVVLQWFFGSRFDRGIYDRLLRGTALLRCYRLFFDGLCFSCWH